MADRHYSRNKVGSPQFCVPGRNLVLRSAIGDVLFVWIWQQYRRDNQKGYYCSIFRNESMRLSSEIILEAEKRAVEKWGTNRFFTFVNAEKIKSVNPGYCFKKAGWKREGFTKGGKIILVKIPQT